MSQPAEDAVIRLIVFDLEGTIPPDLQCNIQAEGVYPPGQYFCRHPSVEVTYYRENGADVGHLGIHVVWAQFTGLIFPVEGDWELFYKYFHVPVYETGIDWNDVTDYPVTPILTAGGLIDDEIQPDLAVDAVNGSMFVVYTKTDEPENTFYQIMVVQGVIHPEGPVFWNQVEYPVPSGPPGAEKGFPKIDVGRINTTYTAPFAERNTAVAVWSEWDPHLQNFQVWHATADPLNPGSIVSMQLTYSENFIIGPHIYEIWDILPSVDIPAPSSRSGINANLQAVICYSSMDVRRVGQEIYTYDTSVHCRITPDIMNDFLLRGDAGHDGASDFIEAWVPEVALHQMNDLLADYQWYGVAMQASVGMTGEPDTYVATWKYQVDNLGNVGIPSLEPEGDWNPGGDYPFWSFDHPATGPTLCLRYFEPLMLVEDQGFGLGWINGGPFDPSEVWLGEGTITQ